MSTPTVYVVCDQNCRWESMTKEQILAAITQAVENHQIADVDTGFVTTIKTVNGIGLKFFIGTQAAWAEYPSDQKEGVFAIFTNDTTGDALKTAIEAVQQALANILDGTQAVPKATLLTPSEWQTCTSGLDDTLTQAGTYHIRCAELHMDFGIVYFAGVGSAGDPTNNVGVAPFVALDLSLKKMYIYNLHIGYNGSIQLYKYTLNNGEIPDSREFLSKTIQYRRIGD